MTEMLESRLRRCEDRAGIADLLNAYSHGIDRRDVSIAAACFHDGATFQYLDSPPVPAAAMFTPELLEAGVLRVTGHYISNLLIEFDGSDRARVQASVVAYHLVAADKPGSAPPFVSREEEYAVVIGARYFDVVERGAAGWRFRSRALTFDWSYEVPAPAIPTAMFGTLDGSHGPALAWLR